MPLRNLSIGGTGGLQIRGLKDVSFTVPDKLVDSFESGNLDSYDSSSGEFDVNNNPPVFEGSFSLKSTTSVNNSHIISYKGDGNPDLENYPTRGDWIRAYFQIEGEDSDERVGITLFGVSGIGIDGGGDYTGYMVQSGLTSSNIVRFDGDGVNDEIASSSVNLSADTWYYVDIFSNKDDIKAEIFNLNGDLQTRYSVTDSTYSGSGFGVRKRSSNAVVDSIKLKENQGI